MEKFDSSFVHLHVHTEYSLMEATSRLEDLLHMAASWNMEAMAITDKGVINGMIPFCKLADECGIHPIIGCEIQVGETGESLILLAANERGYEQIVKQLNDASFYPPDSHGDIIALSGGRTGSIHRLITSGRMDLDEQQALQYMEWFGKEHFYVEVQHHGFEEDDAWLEQTVHLARNMKLPIVATHDVHYLTPEDAPLLNRIRHGKKHPQPAPPDATGPFYLPSPSEMKAKFHHLPDALANTVRIARRCRFQLNPGKYRLPSFPVSQVWSDNQHCCNQGQTTETDAGNLPRNANDALLYLCQEGMQRRFNSSISPLDRLERQRAIERMYQELKVITERGLADYFLIVWDIVMYAKNRGKCLGNG